MTEAEGKPATPPGRTAERISVFTDAVFAIAMTLLVIEIPGPRGRISIRGTGSPSPRPFTGSRISWDSRRARSTPTSSSSTSSGSSGVSITRSSTRSAGCPRGWWLHFPLLLLAAFLPYATTVLGHYQDNPPAALLFGLNVGLLLASRAAIQTLAARDEEILHPETDRHQYHVSIVVAWAVIVYWALTLLFVWWAPWAQIPWAFTGLVGTLVHRLYRGGDRPRPRIRPS